MSFNLISSWNWIKRQISDKLSLADLNEKEYAHIDNKPLELIPFENGDYTRTINADDSEIFTWELEDDFTPVFYNIKINDDEEGVSVEHGGGAMRQNSLKVNNLSSTDSIEVTVWIFRINYHRP